MNDSSSLLVPVAKQIKSTMILMSILAPNMQKPCSGVESFKDGGFRAIVVLNLVRFEQCRGLGSRDCSGFNGIEAGSVYLWNLWLGVSCKTPVRRGTEIKTAASPRAS